MASAQVCPVVGTTTTVLPPDHPALSSDPEARCPVTNAKVSHHSATIHNHPDAPAIPADSKEAMDATKCPVASQSDNATCPVVGSVSAVLPPTHPELTESEAGTVCPVTKATLGHHKDKVLKHPAVPQGSKAEQCPVVGN